MLYMVFDVESIGLHGEGFAVGWVVVDSAGNLIASACYAANPALAHGTDADRAWVAAHVPVPHTGYNCRSLGAVRDEFWRAWSYARNQGAVLVADCAWPVEARFLTACIADDPTVREGPYPLHEVATMRLAAGFDPLATVDRLPNELPAHNPMADARQSARLWLEALARVRSGA